MAENRQGLDIRQAQGLMMTPQLRQAIALLQTSQQELASLIEGELLINPLLEVQETAPDSEGTGVDIPDDLPDLDSGEGDWRTAEGDGAAWDASGHAEGDRLVSLTDTITLTDHLSRQAGLMFSEGHERLIAAQLIDILDGSGYFTEDITRVAERLSEDVIVVEAMLLRLQHCEPAGVFARSLKECLALQLRDRGHLDPWMATLLENLPLVATREHTKLQKIIGCDSDTLAEMLAELKSLDPKPGARFLHVPVEAMIPDVFVCKNANGEWTAELNPQAQPHIVLNSTFYQKASGMMSDKEQKKFLSTCHQNGSFLLKALAQRAETIMRVTTALVARQQDFFDKGIRYLRPMVLREIAEDLGIHESTVSRITTKKYLASPRGTMELKYFFAAGLKNVVGQEGAISARTVQHRISTIIENENPTKPLSDETLVEILGKEGIDVARRTVAKYREGLGIANSAQRRREKRA
ncbi:MAG: RNA polymerase factor sigma-54 [Holosporales bacterium]|jgi:RNA polymerase sigma-54 factor